MSRYRYKKGRSAVDGVFFYSFCNGLFEKVSCMSLDG